MAAARDPVIWPRPSVPGVNRKIAKYGTGEVWLWLGEALGLPYGRLSNSNVNTNANDIFSYEGYSTHCGPNGFLLPEGEAVF